MKILLFLFVFSAGTVHAQDLRVAATLSTDVVGVQDQFELTVTVSGSGSGDVTAPRIPRLQGFQTVQGPSVATQFQWINGQSGSSKSFTYVLLPEKEGQFTIGPVEVQAGGKVYKTQPLSIRVTATSASRPPPQPRRRDPLGDEIFGEAERRVSDGDVFVTAELDRNGAYPGQQVTLSYHLYTQLEITGLQLQESPPLTGFWVEDIEVPRSPPASRKTIDGREYAEYVVKKQALFPNAAGRLTIPAATFAVSAKASGDLFGFFAQSQTLYKKTKVIALDVRALPSKDHPADFQNAVGTFNLIGSLDKSEAGTGEAVSLRIRLEGRGNLKMIPDIALPSLPDFVVYSSKRADNVRVFEGDRIGGDKSWEYVIVPKAPGEQSIPAIAFSYFNPEKDSYETATTQPLRLKVTRGAGAPGALTDLSGINKQSLTRQGTDINFIKTAPAALMPQGEPLYSSPWFYLIAAIPLGLNLGIFLFQRERESEESSPARRRKAKRVALDRLKRAEKAGEPRTFYDESAAALSGFLQDRFDLSEIEVTADNLERTLSEKHIDSDRIKEGVSCLQECDFGRFVSASNSADNVQRLAARIRRAIDELERG